MRMWTIPLAAVLLLVFLIDNNITAAVITVDNKYPYAGDYQTLLEAHNAASAGDTIYVSPSLVPYSGITVTKPLTFLGVGFDLTENLGEPVTTTSTIGQMIFATGSSGSVLDGFDGSFGIYLYDNNITIKRNDLYFLKINPGGSGSTIIQNKIVGYNPHTHATVYIQASNVLLLNNIIINPEGSYGYAILEGSNLTIKNNVLKSNQSLSSMNGSEIINNIIIDGGINAATGSFRYNMSYSNDTELTNGIGNIVNVDMSTVFVDHPNYDFHLSPGSPAIGTGENGTDMGIYGGDAPYVDGGFPGLPSILQILAPTVGSQQGGLDIQFKAKSNKE